MTTIITPRAYDEARRLVESGQTLAGWTVLAEHGDHYANAAVHVLSFKWSLLNCVRAAHWRLTVPDYPIGGEIWNEIARCALRNYLNAIYENSVAHYREFRESPTGHHAFPLPNTEQIERSYMQAVTEVNARRNANVSLKCIIHLAGNRLTTPPNRMIERVFYAVAPWMGPWKCAFRNFTMPDWEKVANKDFGDLTFRQRHDSTQMAPDNYFHNAYVLARAFVCGYTSYFEGLLGARSRQIVPELHAENLKPQ